MKKTQPTPKTSQTSVILRGVFYGGVIVWLLGLTLLFKVTSDSIYQYAKSSSNQLITSRYETYKVQFCYEHDIKPCDDIAIKAYNDTQTNEDEKFSFYYPSMSL